MHQVVIYLDMSVRARMFLSSCSFSLVSTLQEMLDCVMPGTLNFIDAVARLAIDSR